MHDRPVGRGYVQLTETGDGIWPKLDESAGASGEIAAHEFHYASLEDLSGQLRFAYKVMRGHGIDGEHDGMVINNLTACFAHQRNLTSNHWAENFVAFVAQFKTADLPETAKPATLTA
jgi:cobyrinic acid a,c-diamide synthase